MTKHKGHVGKLVIDTTGRLKCHKHLFFDENICFMFER